jgi:hypothetical protein
MGDLQRSLAIMLGEKGCDVGLLQHANGKPVNKNSLIFTPSDQMIMWQYECGSEPVVLLSLFFQLDKPTSHLVLVHLRAQIAQLREPKFAMYADILHSGLQSLTRRLKTEMVVSDEATDRDDHGQVTQMEPCISLFRSILRTTWSSILD